MYIYFFFYYIYIIYIALDWSGKHCILIITKALNNHCSLEVQAIVKCDLYACHIANPAWSNEATSSEGCSENSHPFPDIFTKSEILTMPQRQNETTFFYKNSPQPCNLVGTFSSPHHWIEKLDAFQGCRWMLIWTQRHCFPMRIRSFRLGLLRVGVSPLSFWGSGTLPNGRNLWLIGVILSSY